MLTLTALRLTGPTAAMILETATGRVWLPKAREFGAADGVAELIPLLTPPGTGPNIEGLGVAAVPGFPGVREDGQYRVTLHPAAGGAAIVTGEVLPSTPEVRVTVQVVGG